MTEGGVRSTQGLDPKESRRAKRTRQRAVSRLNSPITHYTARC